MQRRRFINWAIAAVLLVAVPQVLAVEQTVAEKLQEISVTIRTEYGQGSGVIVTRGEYNYILTAAHVIRSLRNEREVTDPETGTKRTVIEFDDASILQLQYEDGENVGKVTMLVKVLHYSDADHGEDIALLRIRKKNFTSGSVEFYLGDRIPPPGTDLYHVGSLSGEAGSNSVTKGIISRVGCKLDSSSDRIFDQTDCTVLPGSSGGGMFLYSDGRYVGMPVRGSANEGSFNLMIPIRRIRAWAERIGVEWVLDPSLPIPTEDEIKKIPIEDIGERQWKREQAAAGSAGPQPQPGPSISISPFEDTSE